MMPHYLEWSPGSPPRRGPWPVKSANGRNPGYRYWDGDRWGQLCSGRAWCAKVKCTGRKTPVESPVLWGRKVYYPEPRYALNRAKERILLDRNSLHLAHWNSATKSVDEEGAKALREYDDVLEIIERTIKGLMR